MLVSFKKTKWVQDWLWTDYLNEFHFKYVTPNKKQLQDCKGKEHGKLIRKMFAEFLATKGYKAKAFEKNEDILISIPDKEVVWLKLKYS